MYFKAHVSDPVMGVSIKTQEFVKDWTTVIKILEGAGTNPNAIIVFDLYYLCNASRNHCISEKKKFIGIVKRARFESNALICLAWRMGNGLLIQYFKPGHESPKYGLTIAFNKIKKPKTTKKKSRAHTIPYF